MDDIEAIRRLKARYCRLLDTKDWDGYRQLFTDDVTMDTTASGGGVVTGAELRAEDRTHRIIGVDQAVAMIQAGAPLALHPLVGGLPPDTAWRYLRTVTDDVMPAL